MRRARRVCLTIGLALLVLLAVSPAAVLAAGTISGKVTDAVTHAGIQNITVDEYDSGGNFPVASTCTLADGSYTLGGLATGTYRVGFNPRGGCGTTTYLGQFYNDKQSLASADPVAVTAGSTASGINAALAMPPGGEVTGTVTDAVSHAPIQNIGVDAYDSGGNVVASTCSPADGIYTLGGLATGTYRVGFTGSSLMCAGPPSYLPQFYGDKRSLASADPVAVTAGSTTSGINAALTAGGQITGTVTDAVSHAPIPNVVVYLYDASGNQLNSTCAGGDGTYELSSLATGSYRVGFLALRNSEFCAPSGGYVPQFYNGKGSVDTADPVAVTAGSTTAGINAAMAPYPGLISGTVTDASTGAAIQGASVSVYDQGGNVIASAATKASGGYEVLVAPGRYRVGFVAAAHVSQFYNQKPSLSSADAVTMAEGGGITGGAVPGIDAAMVALPGQISGSVTGASTKAAILGASVSVYDSGGNVIGSAMTDSSGAYTVSGLAPGSYRVGFTATGHVSQFYNGKPSLASAAPVTVTADSTTAGIDAALAANLPLLPPTITHLGETHKRFRAGSKLATLTRKKAPVGTTFSFTVSTASTVKLSFMRSLNGRRVNGKCGAKTSANKHKHSCKRTVLVGSLSYSAPAGAHKVHFEGRVSRYAKLKPGRYRMVILASDAAGHSQARSLGFTIVK